MDNINEHKKNISNIIKNNDINELNSYINNNNLSICELHCDILDILVIAIEQNASIEMINYIIDNYKYEEFNYASSSYNSPLYYAVKNENFKLADILIKNKANVNFLCDNSLTIIDYLYNKESLSRRQLKYLLYNNSNFSYELIINILSKNETNYLYDIFKYGLYNNSFILKLLSFYHHHTPVSKDSWDILISNEKNKIEIGEFMYETAINNENYKVIKLLYDYDTRDKEDINGELFKIFDNDDRKYCSGKKFIFMNLIEIGELEIPVDEYFLNNLIYIDEKRNILADIIRSGSYSLFKNYINENKFSISYFNTEIMDMLIFSIENNVSLSMIDYISRHYKNLNYTINDILIYRSPLSTALSQNKFEMADILIKYGADINFKVDNKDIYHYLKRYELLNHNNFKYLLKTNFSMESIITKNYIDNLFNNSNLTDLNNIFKHYCFNNAFILNLLFIYEKRNPLSRKELHDMITYEQNKINFNLSLYKNALQINNLNLLKVIVDNDTRKKDIVIDTLFKAIDEDERNNKNGRKDRFIKSIREKSIEFPVDNYFVMNLENIENHRKIMEEMIVKNDFYRFKDYVQEKNFIPSFFNTENKELLCMAIEHSVSLEFIKFILSFNCYKNLNFRAMNKLPPLFIAIGLNSFEVADLLIQKGASINYLINDTDNILVGLKNQHLLNKKNIKYILNHGIAISLSFLYHAINKFKNETMNSIFYHFIYDHQSILQLLRCYKHRISLPNNQLIKMVKNLQEIKNIDYSFFQKALELYNIYIVKKLLKYEIVNLKIILEDKKNDFNKLICVLVLNNDFKLIEKIFGHQSFNFKKIEFEFEFNDILSKSIEIKNRDELEKQFIEKIYNHKEFDFKQIRFKEILQSVLFYRNIANDQEYFKNFIENALQHKTFYFTSIKFNETLSILYKFCDANNCIDLARYYIEQSLHHKTFNFELMNFFEILEIIIPYEDLNTLKLHIEKFYNHSTFYPWTNLYSFLNHTINLCNEKVLGKDEWDSNEFIEFFITESLRKALDITEIDVIDAIRQLNVNKDIMYIDILLKKIKQLFSDKYLDDKLINYSYLLQNSTSNNIQIMEVFIEILFKNDFSSTNITDIERLLTSVNKYNNGYFMKLILDSLLSQTEKTDLEDIHFETLVLSSIEYHHTYIFRLLLSYILSNKTIYKKFNVEKVLLEACKCNETEIIEFILEELLDIPLHQDMIAIYLPFPKKYDSQNRSLILNSILKVGDIALAKCLIENDDCTININQSDENGEYPMMIVYNNIHQYKDGVELFRYFLNHGVNCSNVKNSKGTPLIMLALQDHNYNIIKSLLQINKMIVIDDNDKVTNEKVNKNKNDSNSLISLIYQNDLQGVKSYIDEHEDQLKKNTIKIRTTYGFTPLIFSYLLNHQEIFNYLMHYLNIDEEDDHGYNLLHYTLFKEDFETTNYILDYTAKKGININPNDQKTKNMMKNNEYLAMNIAIDLGNIDMLLTLLENQKNIKISRKATVYEIPIITLMKTNHYTEEIKLKLLEKLLEKGFSAYTKDQEGKYVLTYAIHERSLPMIKLLIKYDAKYDSKNKIKDILKYTIRKGDITTFEYFTANYLHVISLDILKMIIYYNRLEFLKVVIDYKKDFIFMKDKYGDTILTYAIKSRNTSITEYLVKNGASINVINRYNQNQYNINKRCFMVNNDIEYYSRLKSILTVKEE